MSSPAVKSEPTFLSYAVMSDGAGTGPAGPTRRNNDPFTLLKRIDEEVGPDDAVVLEVEGYLNSIGVSHLTTMWRAVVARGAKFRCVLFNTMSYNVVKVLGLHRIIDVRICPHANTKHISGRGIRCHRCSNGCEAGYEL